MNNKAKEPVEADLCPTEGCDSQSFDVLNVQHEGYLTGGYKDFQCEECGAVFRVE